MSAFLEWFNAPANTDGVLRSALAHLWLVTIHPFEDGNGRIARAIADMALARSEASPQRFYSMSSQILRRRSACYRILERTQRGSVDITGWMAWFLDCLGGVIAHSETALAVVLGKARFWEQQRRRVPERAAAQGYQPAAGRLRRQADHYEVVGHDGMLAGHRAA